MIKVLARRLCLLALLVPITVEAAFKPGEGELVDGLDGKTFKVNDHLVTVKGDVRLRYRISTLLGDHVEKFEVLYDLEEITVTTSDYKTLVKAQLDGSGSGVTNYQYHVGVGSDAMSKVRMTSLNFRVDNCATGGGISAGYRIERKYPGVFRPPGKWGWDFPASYRWEKVLKSGGRAVNGTSAKKVWTGLALNSEPLCDFEIVDAEFSYSGLISTIAKALPIVFSESKAVTPAFAQMAMLRDQLKHAEDNGDEDLPRRRRLTDKAWQLLKGDMTAQERLWLNVDEFEDVDENALDRLDALFAQIQRDMTSKSKKLSKQTRSKLNQAIKTYTPRKIAQLKLPSQVADTLRKFANSKGQTQPTQVARTYDNPDWEAKRDSDSYTKARGGNYYLWGFRTNERYPKWTIKPQYRETKRFYYGLAEVQDIETRKWFFISPNNQRVGPDFFSESNKNYYQPVRCLHNVIFRGQEVGSQVFNVKTRQWVTNPSTKSYCEFFDTLGGGKYDQIIIKDKYRGKILSVLDMNGKPLPIKDAYREYGTYEN